MSGFAPVNTDLAKQAGISMRQLDFWCNQGYLGAHLKGNGRGQARQFDCGDRARLLKMAGLVRAGLNARTASAIVFGDNKAFQKLEDALRQAKPL